MKQLFAHGERLYRALIDVGERSGTYLCYRFGFDDGDEHSGKPRNISRLPRTSQNP